MVREQSWKGDRGILVQGAEPTLCVSGFVGLSEGTGVQVLLFALWKRGHLKLKIFSPVPSETRECFPALSTVWSPVQNNWGALRIFFSEDNGNVNRNVK